jgi:replication fork clamp-binding protein CrfC
VKELGQLVDRGLAVSRACDRQDLTDRLHHTRQRLQDPSVRVLIVGEFKQGKSLLVNALVNAPVCPVDDDVATAVPTVVLHGDEPAATLVHADPAGNQFDAEGTLLPLERRSVPLESLTEHVSEAGNPNNERRLACVEVELPRRILSSGLVLVDTPGIGGLGSAHAASTIAALPTADAVLLVSDAAQEYSAPELDFLRAAMKLCPNVACVLTKTDLYPQWRRIAELDRIHLAGAGIEAPLIPVSSTLRLHALETEDSEVNSESGFPVLTRYLQRDIVGQAEELSRRSVLHDVTSVTDHLSVSLQTELEALEDPENAAALIAELQLARDQADELRKRTARWQQTLNDGVTDLMADIDYDLRDRARLITREAEEIIDAADPGQIWDQFGEWLQQRLAAAVQDNFVWAHERSTWLSQLVAEHFAEDGGGELPELQPGNAEAAFEPVLGLTDLDRGTTRLAGKILIGMRGSYGGVLMFGLITGIMGMALLNPISIGAGLILGTKAYRDDKETKVKRRQGEGKVAVRRHVDDVIFQVGKESKDRLRQVQRVLRDHFTDIADEVHRSLSDSVAAAQRAAKTGSAERERRIGEIKNELRRLDALKKQTAALSAS